MAFLGKTWKLIAVLLGFGILREIIQRRKMINLLGKVVLITGGSRGLGLAMAMEFAKQGARLVLCARNEVELERARMKLSELGAEVFIIPCDVSDKDQAQDTIERATALCGRVDILVNNAGIIYVGPWQTQTRADFEESMNSIFWGTYNMTMAALPQMVRRKSGRIVNITSIGGKVSVPHLLSYSGAKFATVGFSEGLRAELAKDGIVVVTVVPGLLRTGSYVNTVIKGDSYQAEYTWFTLLDTLPVSSISARRAAKQIIHATQRGSAELIITIQAQIIARLHGLLPGFTTDLLSWVNRLLPGGEGASTTRHQGAESQTSITKSFLTLLGQHASERYNEQPSDHSS
jgi:NAD(P)-dependent dehydrogenase (short-subunit alcohol dehydrogenase family)